VDERGRMGSGSAGHDAPGQPPALDPRSEPLSLPSESSLRYETAYFPQTEATEPKLSVAFTQTRYVPAVA
jgi:hypothetical protein